ncbi:MAG: DUF4157 domain-containing protein [Candidatus Electrothrix scaldis]|nr:MAG: DUF4157 domain-containing protein [Candidatus Electrothrix sp. GW3-3]
MKDYRAKEQKARKATPAAVRQKKCQGRGCALVGPNHEKLSTLQRMIAEGTPHPLQRNPMPEPDEEELVQRKENKTGMPDEVKQRAESTLNSDFSDVRIHANSAKAPEVGALAYTQGTNIHFAPGTYNPNSNSGRSLLGHELTHVVQQAQGRVQPTTTVAGVPVNDNPALEQEADKLGRKI